MRHIQENTFLAVKDITVFTLIESIYRVVRKIVPQDRPKEQQNQLESSLFVDRYLMAGILYNPSFESESEKPEIPDTEVVTASK